MQTSHRGEARFRSGGLPRLQASGAVAGYSGKTRKFEGAGSTQAIGFDVHAYQGKLR